MNAIGPHLRKHMKTIRICRIWADFKKFHRWRGESTNHFHWDTEPVRESKLRINCTLTNTSRRLRKSSINVITTEKALGSASLRMLRTLLHAAAFLLTLHLYLPLLHDHPLPPVEQCLVERPFLTISSGTRLLKRLSMRINTLQ